MILQLHRDLYKFSNTAIGGSFKSSDNIIAEELPDGTKRVRFQPVPAWETAEAMEQTRAKISTWLNTMGGTGLGAGTSYWSCQEAEDAPHQEAVYMTGAQATKSGTKPVLTGDKHVTRYIRPFIAF